ncbi:hypothetical protein HHX47_DHR1000815 [Lentinula edodes]|nr:hypothetical protein HHX47_DHR1000815 [Lentinula edodes]
MWCSVLPIVLSFFLQLYQVNALKGDSQCGYLVCVNATVHHDTVTYQMTARKEKMGWLALGFGRRMAGSDMVVMWRNEDDSLTISHRHGYDHTEPVVVEEPLRIAFLPMLQPTVWVFKPEKNASFEQLIWAYGMTRPASPDPHTTIYGHYAAGMLLLNLEKDISVTSPEGSLDDTTSSPVISQDPLFYSTHELVVLAHGFLIAIGMLVLLPAGALVARWTRTYSEKWFKIHKTLNYVIALPIILVGWTLGPFVVFNARATHFSDAHQLYQESHGLNPSCTPKHYVALSPDEGHRSMLFDADTDLSTLPDGYPNHSPNGITKEAETAVPLLRRN